MNLERSGWTRKKRITTLMPADMIQIEAFTRPGTCLPRKYLQASGSCPTGSVPKALIRKQPFLQR
jgi:hypothetical protein